MNSFLIHQDFKIINKDFQVIVIFINYIYNILMSAELMGIEIDNYTFEEGVNKGLELMHSGSVAQVVTINPEMYKESEQNEEFKQIIHEAEMVIPDGVGIKLGLLLKGKKAARIAGIDFARKLLEECAKNGDKVAIIGAKEEIVAKAVENLNKEIKGLNIVYYHNGYFNNDNEIYDRLKETRPNLVLAALGSPKQEYFIYNAKKILSPCLMVGIGGSLDVWSGVVKRAPKIWRKLGLEWFYRTVTQPERFKRIFPTLPLFLLKVITYKKDK